ncbi:putative oxysterol-binding protein [Lupinus albus]|uniref:Putative oxysterol-binding protein n=1 Tax=Lupinus albus TaxID=3870 RepID=A0A6A4P585_LUPAL|nr:putative oxysterol-binding protein [Lupinus albus]
MHTLCCISLENPGIGNHSPELEAAPLSRTMSVPTGISYSNAGQVSEATVAGVLYKWTNYGKGWRSRWFLLRNGVLSYAKIRHPENLNLLSPAHDLRLIGHISSHRLARINAAAATRRKTPGVVHLKISSFRESKSDDRRFYIFTAMKTFHLRTDSRKDRVEWIQALLSTRAVYPLQTLSDNLTVAPTGIINVSTERLKKRLLEEGTTDNVVHECQQIMLSECQQIHGQLEILCQERSTLLDTIMHLEAAKIEPVVSAIHDGEYSLTKNKLSNLGRGKYSECSTTESSDDIEKQEMEEVSDEDEMSYYDTREYFTEPGFRYGLTNDMDQVDMENIELEKVVYNYRHPRIARRIMLPDPVEKEKGVSLWSMIKDNVGKDLTRVCLPVYFNEPISSLQKCCEDLEYSHLLDQAYEYGKSVRYTSCS